MNDNRSYKYTKTSINKRIDHSIITTWIKKNSKVIDLGSGDGTLLKILVDERKVNGVGIEISPSGVAVAKKKGIKSTIGRIDVKLPFKDKEFDYAICNVTLQMVMYPEVLLAEMKRISRCQIITFPNFAFILNRLDLFINGVMPRIMIPTYKWFSTGHIHQLSIRDFKIFCRENDMKIVDTKFIGPKKIMVNFLPNLFAMMGVFMTK